MNLRQQIECLSARVTGLEGAGSVNSVRVGLPLSGYDDPRGGNFSYAYDDNLQDGILWLKLDGVWRGIATFAP